ncbi:MAG: site-specific integrase, partial [Bdellovibrionales bacterium]|nr:site-specific integrase [Bdellovibrionales bacterium]
WCEFLGVSPGTTEAATKVKAASELEALAYRKWLETKPGQSPRIFRKNKPSRSKQIAKRKTASAAKDGTQSTLTNSTIRKKIAVLRRIYRLLESCNLSDNGNPFATDKIPPPSALSGQKRPTEMISFEKVMELISLPDDSTPKGLRDKCILAVLFGGGLRRSELVNLRLADLKKTPSGTSFLRLRSTKAKTDADQALPNWAADLIWKLYQSRKSQDAKDGDFLFISYRGKGGLTPTSYKLSDNGLYRLFKNYCSIAGIKEFVSPHSARATAITKLLADGISHRKVQEFSRHASIQMVENYDKRRLTVEDSPAQLLDYKD